MSKTQFTPGPWYLSRSKATISPTSKRVFKSVKTQSGIGGSIVANAFGGSGFDIHVSKSINEAIANARLIAKAPEMYEVLGGLILSDTFREQFPLSANLITKLLNSIQNEQ